MNLWSLIAVFASIVLFILFIKYLFPFIRPLWLPFSAYWGYRIGKRRQKHLNMMYIGSSPKNIQQTTDPEYLEKLLDNFSKKIEELLNDEISKLKAFKNEKSQYLTRNIDEVRSNIKRVRERMSNQVTTAKGHFFGKILTNFDAAFNKDTGKNLLFFIAACVIIIIDTLIAVDIIESLGIFEKDVSLFGNPKGLLYFIGSFITITVAMILHILLGPGIINKLFKGVNWGKVAAATILIVFTGLLILMVFYPDKSRAFFEVVLRFSWVFGVIAVYWLIGQIVGEAHDFKLLFVTVSMFFIPILYPIFGLGFLLELLFSSAWNIIASIVLEMRKARIIKQEQNLNDTTDYFTKGLLRGAKHY